MKAKENTRPKGARANGWRILVAEDDEGVRAALVDVLRLFGHEAETAASGEEALAAFDEARHALLITDQYMPGMQGTELIRTFQQRCPSLPIIALTGAWAQRELLAAGAAECIEKPFDISQIKKAVERGLRCCSEKDEHCRQRIAVA